MDILDQMSQFAVKIHFLKTHKYIDDAAVMLQREGRECRVCV